MGIIIRKIEKIDYNEVMSLWKYLGNKTNNQNFDKVMHAMQNDNNYQTFVAIDKDNEVLGFIMTLQALSIGYEVGFLWICGFAVKEKFQGKGIATKLLSYIEDYGKEKGIENILLNTGFKRKEAHAFYEKNGYTSGSYCYSKNI